MNFRVHREKIEKAVLCASGRYNNHSQVPFWAETVTLEASSSVLLISAFGSDAMIQFRLSQNDGYECIETGAASLSIAELITSLAFLPDGHHLSICTQYREKHTCLLLLIIEANATSMLPIHNTTKVPYGTSEKYDLEVTVHRSTFLHGMKKVKFAMPSKNMFCYECTQFEAWKQRMRFAAGNGFRFAVSTIMLSAPLDIWPDTIRMLIPKQNIAQLIRLFDNVDDMMLDVKCANNVQENKGRKHIRISTPNVAMTIYGHERYTKYPTIDKVLTHPHSYQICTSADDWRRVSNAIHLTNPEYIWTPRTQLTADLHQGYFEIEVNSDSSFRERIDFELESYVANTTQGKFHRPWIRFESSCLHEVAHKMYGADRIQVCFEDQANLDAYLKNGSRTKSAIAVRYPPQKLKDGSTETRIIFFGVSTAEFK